MSTNASTILFDDNDPKPARSNSVHFSSATDVWATPQSLFDELNAEFRFTIDVCALPTNAKCDSYFTPEMDGLTQAWKGVCWMNPPHQPVEKPATDCENPRSCRCQWGCICPNRPFSTRCYGRSIGQWVQKAHESSLAGTTVVYLIPSRTDTKWWHGYVTKADEVRFVRGRIRFGGAAASAPFPSAIVIFRGKQPAPTPWTRGVFYRRELCKVTGQ